MLIPVYIVGFILGGLVCFAIAQRVPNRPVKICLRTIGVVAGPVFFLVVAIFSGWEREKTYEVEWLVGRPAAEYLGYHKSDMDNLSATNPVTGKKREELVVLKRNVDNNYDCYTTFTSSALAEYLEGLPTHSVKVQYKVTYDFYVARGYRVESVGDFGRTPATQREISIGGLGGGIRVFGDSRESCFPW